MKRIKQKIKKALKRCARRSDAFDSIYAAVIRRRRAKRFLRYADLPVDENLVLFESFKGKHYSDNPRAIYEYMLEHSEFDIYRFVWCMRRNARGSADVPEKDPRTEIVDWGSDDYYRAYAMAKYWVPNTRIPEAIQKKDEQIYLQCMHGTPLKRTGIDTRIPIDKTREVTRRVIHKDVSRYSYLISQSPYFTEVISSAFDLKALGKENVIVETGYPRNDSIVNHDGNDAKKIRCELGIGIDKRVILYAPTYRGSGRESKYEYQEPLDLVRFFDRIPEDIVILFRPHYFISQRFDFDQYGDRLVDVSDYPKINDLYIISDALITDYSSVMFDYGILQRPIIYYMYDLEDFRDHVRGFYISETELPGPITTTQEDLETAIISMDEWAYTEAQAEKLADFRNRFAPYDDGNASRRAADLIRR